MLNFDKWLLLALGIHGYKLGNALDYHYFFSRVICICGREDWSVDSYIIKMIFFLMNIDQHMDSYFSIMDSILKYL